MSYPIPIEVYVKMLEKRAGILREIAPYAIGTGVGIAGTLAASKLLKKKQFDIPIDINRVSPQGRGRGGFGMAQCPLQGNRQYRTNAPTFAYKAVHGKEPDIFLRGRTDSPKKMWRGIEVDKNLKSKWLEGINNNPHIEVRGTDEGKSALRVPFVSFRLQDVKQDAQAGKVVGELNKIPGVHAAYEKGAEDRNRIVVAGKTWKGKKDWSSWWDKLPSRLRKATDDVLVK